MNVINNNYPEAEVNKCKKDDCIIANTYLTSTHVILKVCGSGLKMYLDFVHSLSV